MPRLKGIPFTLSTVSVCPIEEVAPAIDRPMWFQLYVLKDRGFMRNALERAKAAGVKTLVFTVDMPVPGARYRDAHSGMSGLTPRCAACCRRLPIRSGHGMSACSASRTIWATSRPTAANPPARRLHRLAGRQLRSVDFWKDLEWIREFWDGPMIIKGILDPEDAKDAVRFGADGIIVSNHGGRQLDGVLSTARAMPAIADAVKGDITLLADSGIRSGRTWCA